MAELLFYVSTRIISLSGNNKQHRCLVTTRKKQLTSREPVPHLQPVVLAVPVAARQGVVLQVKGEKGEGYVHAGGHDNDEGALQVVRVLVREARRLDETRGTRKVTGTV